MHRLLSTCAPAVRLVRGYLKITLILNGNFKAKTQAFSVPPKGKHSKFKMLLSYLTKFKFINFN